MRSLPWPSMFIPVYVIWQCPPTSRSCSRASANRCRTSFPLLAVRCSSDRLPCVMRLGLRTHFFSCSKLYFVDAGPGRLRTSMSAQQCFLLDEPVAMHRRTAPGLASSRRSKGRLQRRFFLIRVTGASSMIDRSCHLSIPRSFMPSRQGVRRLVLQGVESARFSLCFVRACVCPRASPSFAPPHLATPTKRRNPQAANGIFASIVVHPCYSLP